MARLASNDPVSQAIASSFLDFLQHSLELPDDADAEALEVATDCLRTVFNLDSAGAVHTAQPSGGFYTGGPQLLPEIFRRLLNHPGQSAGVSGIGLGAPAEGLVNPIYGLESSGPGVSGHGSQEPRSDEQFVDRAAQQGRDVRRRVEAQPPELVGLAHSRGLRGSNLGLGGSEQGVQGLGQGLGNLGQGLGVTNPGAQHQRGGAVFDGSNSAQLQPAGATEKTPMLDTTQPSQLEVDKSPQSGEALLPESRPAGQSALPTEASSGEGGTGPGVLGVGPSTPQQKEQRSSHVAGAMQSEGREEARGKRKEVASRAAGSSGVEASDQTWRKEADELKKQGNEAMAAGRHFEALQLYTQAVSMVDTEAIYYANRAAAHHQLRQFDLAIKDCEQSIWLDPRYARAYSRLGLAYFEKGDYQTAIDRGFVKALELDPDNAIVKQNLKAAQEKMARQAGREHPPRPQQPPPNPQEASSGVPPGTSAQSQPQVPQTVQGLVDMATNFFTPLASMATGAASSGQNQPGQAAGGFGTGGHPPGGSSPGTGATPNQSGNTNPGGGNPAQPGQPSANPWGQFQQAFGRGQGARGDHPVFTVNVGGDQAGQQAQQLLTQMFQAFGAAAQRSGGQGGAGPNPGVPQNHS